MPGDPGVSIALHHKDVAGIARRYLKRGHVAQIPQVHAALNFTLDDIPVNLIAEILVRLKHPSSILHRPGVAAIRYTENSHPGSRAMKITSTF
jgi:hypothetical protein